MNLDEISKALDANTFNVTVLNSSFQLRRQSSALMNDLKNTSFFGTMRMDDLKKFFADRVIMNWTDVKIKSDTGVVDWPFTCGNAFVAFKSDDDLFAALLQAFIGSSNV